MTGTASVSGSTFSGNQATAPGSFNPSGGGLFVQSGAVTVTNSTFTGNSAGSTGTGSGYGGAVFRCCGAPAVALVNDTLDANTVSGPNDSGGDVASGNSQPAVTALNTIIAGGNGPAGYQNCGEAETSLGHNLESANSCGLTGAGDKVNASPDLGALASNGGATQTMALLSGSPAIDAGSPASSCPATRPARRCAAGQRRGELRHRGLRGPGCARQWPGGGRDPGEDRAPAGGSHAVAPSCRLIKSSAVKLAKHKKHHQPGTGALVLKVDCSQAVRVTLSWTVVESLPSRHHHKGKTRRFHLPRITASLPAGATKTLTVKLSRAALSALLAGKVESARFTLVARDANGSYTTTVKIKRLRR